MEERDVHGHSVKFSAGEHKEELKACVHHLQAMSFDSAEATFTRANSIHRVDLAHNGHTFVLIAEAHGYLLEMKH